MGITTTPTTVEVTGVSVPATAVPDQVECGPSQPEGPAEQPGVYRTVGVALFCGAGTMPIDVVMVERVVPDDGAP